MLFKLHENGILHGDIRVPNVIFVEAKPLWIDLVELMRPLPVTRELDAAILVRSILTVSYRCSVGEALDGRIKTYGRSSTKEISIVWSKLCGQI